MKPFYIDCDRHMFPQLTHLVGKIEINTAIVFQTGKFLDITITRETLLINNVNENVSELVIITEVKFIQTFLHVVCENCPGKKWLKLEVYIDNHEGNVHYFKFFILRSVMLTQFRKSVGPCPALYKYNRDVVITLYCIVKSDCLAFKTNLFLYFLTIKTF